MIDLAGAGLEASLLGTEPRAAAARLKAIAAAEGAAIALCRLACEVERLSDAKVWLRLEALAGLAAAARASGEAIEFTDLVRNRLGLHTIDDLALSDLSRTLADTWSAHCRREAALRRDRVVVELLRGDDGDERPSSLIALGLRLEQIARSASWPRLAAREFRVDHEGQSVTIGSSGEASSAGDYLLAQAFVFERLGLTSCRLPGIGAPPALLTSTDGDMFDRLMRWLGALENSVAAARRRLARYRRFENRVALAMAKRDKRRRAVLAKLMALFAEHWTLWPRKVAAISSVPHNTAWRAMSDAADDGLLCRLAGRAFAGGANVYVLAPVAEAAGLRAAIDDDPLPSPAQGVLKLESASALEAAVADIDRLIGRGRDDDLGLFSLDDVEL